MKNFLLKLFCYFARALIFLRYRIQFQGLDELLSHPDLQKGGALFLPNHPAHIDPIIIAIYLWPKYKIRPLVVETIYRQPWIHKILKLVNTLCVPNFGVSANEIKIVKAKESIDEVIQKINQGDNFLLYPSGRLKHTGKEILGGASALHTILAARKEKIFVVLIRTTGLWGSSFSRAYEGKSPDFTKTLLRNFVHLLKNFIFFIPKRKVFVTFEVNPKDFPKNAHRLELNQYLEKWYNQYPSNGDLVAIEPLYNVSYSFYRPVYLKTKEKVFKHKPILKERASEIEREILGELKKRFPKSQITLETDLSQDLGMDSIDIAEMVAFLHTHYDIEEVHPEEIQTVLDLIDLAENKEKERLFDERERGKTFHEWPKEEKRLDSVPPQGKTIPEAFFLISDRMKNFSACADDLMGILSYKKLKIAVLALAEEIKKIPGKNVGVLLPASSAAYLLILATLVAKKTPVMLNWTLGPRYLDAMIEMAKVEKVLTSWRFLDRLDRVEFGKLTHQVVLLEEMKMKISLINRLKAFFKATRKTPKLLKLLGLDSIKEKDVAVILFTSGTEALPKGVPLTHQNILVNQKAALECVDLNKKDILLGSLPPFHSFGFSVVGLLPILSGIKVFFSPDPTDSLALAEGIHRWKITLACLAPSFMKSLIQVAKPSELESVRLFVCGAEKTPKILYEKIRSLFPKALLIEGYGITECSPILTINRPHLPPIGVGQPLPGVKFCLIDPETRKLLPNDKEGEFCVRGNNVFSGYLGKVKSPFIQIDHEEWYVTGDMGYIDPSGNIILSGRLKRFAKVGGEMVSLAAIEEEVVNFFQKNIEKPTFALLAKEEEDKKSSLILFTTLPIELREINQHLKEAGFSWLVKISEVKWIKEIPLTGTGKTDYRLLQEHFL